MATRRFELSQEAKWMHYSIDDLLYGMIQHFATYNDKEENENHKLYLTKQNYAKNKKLIREICGTTAQTLNNHLKKLIKEGVIEEFTLKIGDTEYPSYGIVVDKSMPYKIIDNDWLFYLLSTRNANGIKVYFTLLDWYEFKKDYEFSQKQIAEVLGYSVSGGNDAPAAMVGCILRSFKREGVIDYEEYYEERLDKNGNTVQMPKKKLTFVAKSESEIKGHKF